MILVPPFHAKVCDLNSLKCFYIATDLSECLEQIQYPSLWKAAGLGSQLVGLPLSQRRRKRLAQFPGYRSLFQHFTLREIWILWLMTVIDEFDHCQICRLFSNFQQPGWCHPCECLSQTRPSPAKGVCTCGWNAAILKVYDAFTKKNLPVAHL